MTSPVTTTDLEARWRPFTSTTEVMSAEALLEDAWALVQASIGPTVAASATPGSQALQSLRAVMCAMVIRVLRNPDGKVSETIGNYSYTVRSDAPAGLFLSPAEMSLLRQTFGIGGGLYSVPLSTPADISYPAPLT